MMLFNRMRVWMVDVMMMLKCMKVRERSSIFPMPMRVRGPEIGDGFESPRR